jgi:hypothetical protein
MDSKSLGNDSNGNSNSNECIGLDGQVHWSESFRAIPEAQKQMLTDKLGEKWVQETGTGWRRESDGFFWPVNPTNTENFINSLPPSVSEISETRNKYCK